MTQAQDGHEGYMPKLVVGKMPWQEPPKPADRQEKIGPQAAAVDRLYGSRSPSGAPGSSEA